jgi:hypothetical protein
MRSAAVVFLVSCAGPIALRPDVGRIADPGAWRVINAEPHVAAEDGKPVLRLAPVGGNRKGSNIALALVGGVNCAEATIDVDLRGQGEASASFVGVAFGVRDAEHYEAVYFRPFRFRSASAVDRSHAVQYVAWPEHTWEALRARSPGVYEAAIAPVPDPAGWFHARIEVGRTRVQVFVDGAVQPTLAVPRLGSMSGGVGLWVDSQEASFANLQIRLPSSPTAH